MNKKSKSQTLPSLWVRVQKGHFVLRLVLPVRWLMVASPVLAYLIANPTQLTQLLQAVIAWLS